MTLLVEQPCPGHAVICFVLRQMIIHQKHMAAYKSSIRFSTSCRIEDVKELKGDGLKLDAATR